MIQEQITICSHSSFRKRISRLHMPHHFFDSSIVIAFCPQKFLKIHRMHVIICLIAHTVALYSLIGDTQQRTAADYIKAAVNLKKFQGRNDFRIILKFVKKKQRLSRLKMLRRIYPRNISDHLIRFVSVFCNKFVFWFFNKIDIKLFF